MLYLIFSLAALFLTACGDPDNPVYTAPAGKAVTDDEEPNYGSYDEIPYVPADPPETAAQTLADGQTASNKLVGNLSIASGNPSGLDKDFRQDFTTGPDARSWKLTEVRLHITNTQADEVPTFTVEIWTTDSDATRLGTLLPPSPLIDGLNGFTGDINLDANTTYSVVVDVSNTGDINLNVIFQDGEDPDKAVGWSIADEHCQGDDPHGTVWDYCSYANSFRMEIYGVAIPLFTQSEVDAHSTDPLPEADNPSEIRQEASRHQQLREDGVLPTISVKGCRDGNNAVFTFCRNGPTTENLAFTFSVDGGKTTISMGFGAGNAARKWSTFFNKEVWVKIEKAYHNYHSGDYIVDDPWPLKVDDSPETDVCPNPPDPDPCP